MTPPERANPFADIDELPAFQPPAFQTKAPPKPVPREQIDRIAEANDFPSRQPACAASAPPMKRPKRLYRTGRVQQVNIKATPETIERFYRLADAQRVPLGELFDRALVALERSIGQGSPT